MTDFARVRCICMVFLSAALTVSCAHLDGRQALYQTSVLRALMQGGYDADQTLGELCSHGNFGLGTFEALDGEMVLYQGQAYQARADGSVHLAADSLKTPFAAVCFFRPQSTYEIEAESGLDALHQRLNDLRTTPNIFYACLVSGRFNHVKVRSVPAQKKPYPTLVEVAKSQPVFEARDLPGVMVGFWCPEYARGLNVPGYHFHFLSADRKFGGHVLACTLAQGEVALTPLRDLHLSLPAGPEFDTLDLSPDQPGEIEKVEK